MVLEALQAKYPDRKGIKYEPDPNCHWCKGTGEATNGRGQKHPCICTYVGDHAAADRAQRVFNEMTQEYRAGRG
jgi:hypothetical protein